MSGRKAKGRRRAGHPARVTERSAPPSKRARALKGIQPARSPRRGRSARRVAPRTRARWLSSLDQRLRRAWLGVLKTDPLAGRRPAVPLVELSRRDHLWAAATGMLAAALFATAITSHPALGDAPETVAGVSSLGILHSPGYPAYVLVAKLFTLLFPFGSEAFRVNLFSLLCASLSVAGVHLLARRCGAARWAASLGALALAASTGFWFYAVFAKHDMFSGLMVLIALYLLVDWRERPATGKLVGAAAAIAAGLGASWPLMILLTPTVGFVVLASFRKLSFRSLAYATATGLVLLVGVYGFVLVRASQNPPINWGQATNVANLVQLINRADFNPPARPTNTSPLSTGGSSTAPNAQVGGSTATIAPAGLVSDAISEYEPIFVRELGVLGVLLAAIGALATLWRRTRATYPLLITFGANLVGAASVVSIPTNLGVNADLIVEGFLLTCFFVLACWLAIGATQLVHGVGALAARRRLHGRVDRRVLQAAAAAAIAAVVLVPALSSHPSQVRRDLSPFADRYAQTLFKELPPHAAVVLVGWERATPLLYRQVVYHQRRDVLVVSADGLNHDWYRQQLRRSIGRPPPAAVANDVLNTRIFVKWLGGLRPVYLDPSTAQLLGGQFRQGGGVGDDIGYRQVGLLAQLVPGSGPQPVSSPGQVDQTVRASERAVGLPNQHWLEWPNDYVAYTVFLNANLEVFRAYVKTGDTAGMRGVLLNMLHIDPNDPAAVQNLAKLNAAQGKSLAPAIGVRPSAGASPGGGFPNGSGP